MHIGLIDLIKKNSLNTKTIMERMKKVEKYI